MQDLEWHFEGVRNRWKASPGYIQWFSCSCETAIPSGKLEFISAHLWILGIQIFEFSVYRKKTKS